MLRCDVIGGGRGAGYKGGSNGFLLLFLFYTVLLSERLYCLNTELATAVLLLRLHAEKVKK